MLRCCRFFHAALLKAAATRVAAIFFAIAYGAMPYAVIFCHAIFH